MRIYCDSLDVFVGPEHRSLQRLLMRVRLGQHELVLENLDGFFTSEFFQHAVAANDRLEVEELLGRQHPELADRGLDPAARTAGPRAELVPITVAERACRTVNGHPIWEIDPETVGDWCEMPLRVLLENDADWQLVAVAARVYGRSKVEEARRSRFLQLDQRGGKGEIKNAVAVCEPPERVFILMDSDRVVTDGPEERTQQKIRDLAQLQPNVLPFILAKRELENYLPAAVWQDAVARRRTPERVRKLREWQRLSDSDKDVIDLEQYFADAKQQTAKFADVALIPDAETLETRAGTTELRDLLDAMEAWL